MISNINEGTLRTVSKIDTAGAVQERGLSQQKAEEVRQVRPVEDSSKYVVDDNQVFFEKYDSKGELILRIPPSQKPVDERV